ncbi:MAG: hypothetical protein DWB56_13015 [Candidatus Jettenia sp.]|uniref:Uncharacterized protein n=1 Tax=Candidatus Jettenia caeni TaxID=247490 RepID=I3IHI4_9BACT|nr:hypothetical protein [Candidatus Jettenia sp. AMX1]MBC6929857.1 hypothetical protein [Candidatus Jettenia sp.]NUN23694.1 hypothetical protein [Candidatus Jettenia caeni]KAA0248638.1 MAG: hypothetical protein EDM77_11705 [Candidatus Jettenia sp. AMX1]MCE7881498.1 hypothetical protein [Candidatus Jettenia sp. AMX1]MCQ3928115.1 hypothetical protein [Candidatus Jettenia sp.]
MDTEGIKAVMVTLGAIIALPMQESKTGLSIIPAKGEKLANSFFVSVQHLACKNCGNIVSKQKREEQSCKIYKENDWVSA